MKRLQMWAAIGFLLSGTGCVPPGLETLRSTLGLSTSGMSSNNGTGLVASVAAMEPECQGTTEALVTLSAVLTSTGSVADTQVTAIIDGGTPLAVGAIAPEDFVHAGRIKTAPFTVPLTLANGNHTIVLEFSQSGAEGRASKTATTAPIAVSVACQVQNPCADVVATGQVSGNTNLCRNNLQNLPVHVSGDFGDQPDIRIVGPNGYRLDDTLRRSGDSCQYQYAWLPTGNGGAGTYSITVSGNNRTYTFTQAMTCD